MCFLFITNNYLHSTNADKEQAVFKIIQAVVDMGFEVHFNSSVFYQGVRQLNCCYCPATCYFIFHAGEWVLKDF